VASPEADVGTDAGVEVPFGELTDVVNDEEVPTEQIAPPLEAESKPWEAAYNTWDPAR
jgi:hypothetical protein